MSQDKFEEMARELGVTLQWGASDPRIAGLAAVLRRVDREARDDEAAAIFASIESIVRHALATLHPPADARKEQ